MSTLKKVLALTLALAMVMSLGVFAAFKDQATIDEDCVDAMETMNALGIMLGDNNGNANPTKTITRAEAAAMIFRLMNKGKDDATIYNGAKYFSDVPVGAWYEGYVNYAFTMGIINGRTTTTFDPNAPVTGYEIAKMLLGCLKYRADLEGYTGAQWAANVQNDAFAAGLLDDYGMALSAPAQRQWVSVMFTSVLSSCFVTYSDGEAVEGTVTLGTKNFGMKTYDGLLEAAGYAVIDDVTVSVPSTDDQADYSFVKGLGTLEFAADVNLLGQEVEVLYKASTSGGVSKVYSIKATGDSLVGVTTMDKVDTNSTDTKYIIGDLTAAMSADVKVFTNYFDSTDNTIYLKQYGFAKFDSYDGESLGVTVKAVASTGTKIDYIFIMDTFAVQTVTAKPSHSTSNEEWTFNATAYPDTLFDGIENVAKGDQVKIVANVVSQKLEMTVLASTASAILNQVDNSNATITVGGKTYDLGYGFSTTGLTLGDEYDVYVVGGYVVKVVETDDSTVDTLPSNLAMVTAKGQKADPYGAEGDYIYYVKLLTLDGKVAEYEYVQASSSYVDEGAYSVGTVYKYVVDEDDGTVALKVFTTATTDTVQVNNAAGVSSVNITNKTIKTMPIATSTKLFVSYLNSSDVRKFAVMTVSDFSATQSTTSSQLFYAKVNGINTVLGGALVFGTITDGVTDVDKYVVSTSASYVYYDGDYYYNYLPVKYMDGTTENLVLAQDDDPLTTPTSYTDDTIYVVLSKDSDGVSTIEAATVPTAANIDGVSGQYVDINGTVQILDTDCVVIVKTIKSGTSTSVKSMVVNGDAAAVYADYADNGIYSYIKGAVVDTVGGTGTDANYVSVLYIEVKLA
jgi:S-layer homology domain.